MIYLDNITFPAPLFEDITILYGSNGSGKTTSLNIVADMIDAEREFE